jgi:hypothetical protein
MKHIARFTLLVSCVIRNMTITELLKGLWRKIQTPIITVQTLTVIIFFLIFTKRVTSVTLHRKKCHCNPLLLKNIIVITLLRVLNQFVNVFDSKGRTLPPVEFAFSFTLKLISYKTNSKLAISHTQHTISLGC